MNFKVFAEAVNKQFLEMANGELFVVSTDRNTIWDKYLESYPEGTNPIYKERTEHDCQLCKQFIRNVGNVVAFKDGSLQTVWDIELPDETSGFAHVARELSQFVKTLPIANAFLKQEYKYGLQSNIQVTDSGSILWEHFHCDIPNKFYLQFPDTKLGEIRTSKELLERGLTELTLEALDTVIELISQDSLYRGSEHLPALNAFRKLHKENDGTMNYLWLNCKNPYARFKNTVIGTLVQDLSEGMDLDRAVSSFETKVAPQNYKRTTALVTQGMINKAMETIDSLGIEQSLHRRHCELTDISVNNVLFADRTSKAIMKDSLSDLLKPTKKSANLSKIEEISSEYFINDVLPNISGLEIMLEGRHSANLMSLIAPQYESPNILKWSNNFSWAYNGGVTDSIKERVKEAGGNVSGVFRISLSWINNDDLDLHVKEPTGNTIYYSSKISNTGMRLDVDMMSGGTPQKPSVENIYCTSLSQMREGTYKVRVNQYAQRSKQDQGYTIQVEFNGEIVEYYNPTNQTTGKTDDIVSITYRNGKVTFSEVGQGITSGSISQEIWGLSTKEFHKVNVVTLSPNFWDDNKSGNKHLFFIMDNCKTPDVITGIYNEFLSNELQPHRKVFEMIGGKLKVEPSDNQMSGLGFSSTKRDSVIVKCSGNFTRQLKINF